MVSVPGIEQGQIFATLL